MLLLIQEVISAHFQQRVYYCTCLWMPRGLRGAAPPFAAFSRAKKLNAHEVDDATALARWEKQGWCHVLPRSKAGTSHSEWARTEFKRKSSALARQ